MPLQQDNVTDSHCATKSVSKLTLLIRCVTFQSSKLSSRPYKLGGPPSTKFVKKCKNLEIRSYHYNAIKERMETKEYILQRIGKNCLKWFRYALRMDDENG